MPDHAQSTYVLMRVPTQGADVGQSRYNEDFIFYIFILPFLMVFNFVVFF